MQKPATETVWSGPFGAAYTDRNPRTMAELDALYRERFGVTRTAVNTEFLAPVDRDGSVLEVGANVGLQLQGLRALGFHRLVGLELQGYALQQARVVTPDAVMVQGSGLALPFADGSFDMVFTSALLIHIPPDLLPQALSEICRCARRYVWGWEYYAAECTPVEYRGQRDVLWKTDFAQAFLDHIPGLERVMERRMPYPGTDLLDTVYLLQKVSP